MNKINSVGIQTYSLRDMFEQAPRKTLQMIKDVGYDYVELNSRNFQQVEPTKLRKMLDEVGLPAPSSHISIDMLSGDLDELGMLADTLGCKYLVVPYIAEDQRTLEHWRAHAKIMDQAGKVLADKGHRLAYHNHQFEFEDLGGGTTAMEIIMNEVSAEHLDIQLDLFWSALVDVDVPALFRKYPGRFKLCHIKDMGPNKSEFEGADYNTITRDLMKNVGEGQLDFKSIFAMNDLSGMEYFIAEHDQPPKPFKDSIATSLKTVKSYRF